MIYKIRFRGTLCRGVVVCIIYMSSEEVISAFEVVQSVGNSGFGDLTDISVVEKSGVWVNT